MQHHKHLTNHFHVILLIFIQILLDISLIHSYYPYKYLFFILVSIQLIDKVIKRLK